MKRVLKWLAVGTAVLAVGPAVWVVMNWAVLSTFPGMPSSYEAKEYCSCRWVSGRDDTFCAGFVHQDVVPSQGRVVDEAGKRVTASALGVSSTAIWTGPRTGCRVE